MSRIVINRGNPLLVETRGAVQQQHRLCGASVFNSKACARAAQRTSAAAAAARAACHQFITTAVHVLPDDAAVVGCCLQTLSGHTHIQTKQRNNK